MTGANDEQPRGGKYKLISNLYPAVAVKNYA